MMDVAPPTLELRRTALQEVLESQAFSRSEQLKNFLRYVCELEIAGRAVEIKEYSIGVEALGRPQSYSPVDDSSVRRRAFELRNKLADLYAGELSTSRIVIDLPKGSYVPVFRYREAAEESARAPVIEPILAPKPRLPLAQISIAILSGILMGAMAMRFFAPPAAGVASPADIVREAWGPLGAPQSSVLMCIASNFHMAVRSGTFSAESDLPTFPAPAEIYPLYKKSNPMPANGRLLMRPANSVTSLGVVAAVATASSTLRGLRGPVSDLARAISAARKFPQPQRHSHWGWHELVRGLETHGPCPDGRRS